MNTPDRLQQETRRHFFRRGALGLGGAALGSLCPPGLTCSAADHLQHTLPRLAPKAKRAIYLFMSGGPSQMDLFDYKPKMEARYDTPLPDSVRRGQRLTGMTSGQERFPIAPSMYTFKQYGQSGAWVSELLPWTAKIVDDLAFIRSVHTEAINHDPAITYMMTGNQIPGKASLGAWLSYGLGSMNQNLPTFVVLNSSWSAKREAQALFSRLWGSGYLPTRHAGVALRSKGDAVLYLANPPGMDRDLRRGMIDGVNDLNRHYFERTGDPEALSRISQYELAFRMQASVPELTDLSSEPATTWDLYGPDSRNPGTFAANCLLARRMVERGVRFVQIYHRGWDQHDDIARDLPLQCRDIDQGAYGLIQDLKQRGLLDETLVIWGGEFGRTIYSQGKLTRSDYGRDHHPRCFTMWMAGGGIKPGTVYGETDDFCYNIVRDPVHVRDLNATILHQLGIDHNRLVFPHQGLDERLTGVEPAKVIKSLLL